MALRKMKITKQEEDYVKNDVLVVAEALYIILENAERNTVPLICLAAINGDTCKKENFRNFL